MKPPRGPNKIHEIGVSLVDLYKGKTFKLNMKRDILCSGCNGKGGYSVETCGACSGKGFRMRGQQIGPIMAMTQEPCSACSQTGEKITDTCDSCKGKRIQESESVLDVVIEPGMSEGDRLTFPGQCSESHLFEAPGDVILVLRAASTSSTGSEEPEVWVRKGADLTREIHLTLAESLLGWERQLDAHPSTKPLHVVWKGGVVREGEVLRIQGWGMPLRNGGSISSRLGDLRLVCHVDIPSNQCAWSEEQLRVLKSVWTDWKEPVATEESVVPGR
jgi:DnaJ family protein A protein 2